MKVNQWVVVKYHDNFVTGKSKTVAGVIDEIVLDPFSYFVVKHGEKYIVIFMEDIEEFRILKDVT